MPKLKLKLIKPEDVENEDLPTGQPNSPTSGRRQGNNLNEKAKVTSSRTELLATNNETMADDEFDGLTENTVTEAMGYSAVKSIQEI